MNLTIGTQDKIEFKVKQSDLASNLNISEYDGFPDVFATARMVALMECSAAKILIPLLKEGELSVGVAVNITHLAPTLEGDTAISTATFEGTWSVGAVSRNSFSQAVNNIFTTNIAMKIIIFFFILIILKFNI